MEKKEIITIGGKPGSGKSTTSKKLAAQLGYDHFSSGELFRSIGTERGIDVYDTNVLAETEREIDLAVDARLKEIGESKNKLVIDSRMAWYWMPYSFRVYLELDLGVAAARILRDMSPERIAAEHIPSTVEEYTAVLTKRLDSEAKRYMELYNQNPYDTSHYDLVLDTAQYNSEEVIVRICDAYKAWR